MEVLRLTLGGRSGGRPTLDKRIAPLWQSELFEVVTLRPMFVSRDDLTQARPTYRFLTCVTLERSTEIQLPRRLIHKRKSDFPMRGCEISAPDGSIRFRASEIEVFRSRTSLHV